MEDPHRCIEAGGRAEALELASWLFEEWQQTTFEVLHRAVGTDRLKVLKWKYLHTSGVAGGLNLRHWGVLKPDGLTSMAKALEFAARACGSRPVPIKIFEKEARLTVTRCHFSRNMIGQELCACSCEPLLNGFCEGFDDRFVVEIPSALAKGDAACCWRVLERGVEGREYHEDDAPKATIPPHEFSVEEMEVFWLGYRGEAFVIACKELTDPSVPAGSVVKAMSCMRALGQDIAPRLAERACPGGEVSIGLAREVAGRCSRALNQKGAMSVKGDPVEMTVEECPFSSAPPEACMLIESFWDGFTSSLDGDHEFSYDRMMTKGDKTCHWTMRRRAEAARKAPTQEMAEDDALSALRLRFAKGELTPEQYRQFRDILFEK